MPKTIILTALAILCGLVTVSCRSSRTLTEATEVVQSVDVMQENGSASSSMNGSTAEVVKAPLVIGQDDRQEDVAVVDAAESRLLKDYNVVVGSFGKKSNAENYRDTMRGRNYQAFLIQNASGLYRVVAASTDSRNAALEARDQIRATFANEDQDLCPSAWLLIPMQQ